MSLSKKTLTIAGISLVGAAIVVCAAVWLVSSYLDRQYASLHDGCMPRQANHIVTIKNDAMTPTDTTALRCETMTVINLDDEDRMIAFGIHEKHTPYDGIEEQHLVRGESFTVTLVETGSFRVHDHEHDEVQAMFEVK